MPAPILVRTWKVRTLPLVGGSVAPMLLGIAAGAGCGLRSDRFAELDEPPPPPQPVDGPQGGFEAAAPDEPDPATCGRGTGRRADGTCVRLRTRDLPHVQQVQIPAGTFVLGSPPRSYDAGAALSAPAVRFPGQPPRHAELPAFWIDLHEVTRGAYAACVEAGACTPARCPQGAPDPTEGYSMAVTPRLPQTCVTHDQAEAFCAYVGGRLPTAAELEYAARGPDARPFAWGTRILDEVPQRLVPVGAFRLDASYFGVLGLGSNGWEWTADAYPDPDFRLRPFLRAPFRDRRGPVARARADFERRLACGADPEPGCSPTGADRARFVIKGTYAGEIYAARGRDPAHPAPAELEGWPLFSHGPNLAFRCAADLDPQDEGLEVPAGPADVPLLRAMGGLELFGGVAEAVSRREAAAFCAALAVPDPATGRTVTGFRLPTREEVRALAENFRGPGPFWARDGAIGQYDPRRPQKVAPDAPWEDLELPPDTPLLARCVRSLGTEGEGAEG